jgi:hypothetical protein
VLQYRALLDGIDYGTGRTGVPGDLVKTKTWLNWKDVPVASHINTHLCIFCWCTLQPQVCVGPCREKRGHGKVGAGPPALTDRTLTLA